MEVKFNIEWDYNGWEKLVTFADSYTQIEWNQTLITRINQISASIHQVTYISGANAIKTNKDIFNIIKSFEYYNPNTKKLGERYDVIIDDTIKDNNIFIYNTKGLDLNFIYDVENCKSNDDSELDSIKLITKDINDYSEDEISNYRKKFCGVIKINNYNENK